ncbi:MAG: TatD family hydrolase [Opitutae bacterium]|nr:TatD family hydrolase [Opitutae bacterium]
MLPLYDAHNHLQDDWLAPHHPALLHELPALGLRAAVVNGTCEADWASVASLAQAAPWVRPSYGLHPWDAGNRSRDWQAHLRAQLAADPHAAVGEIGLDRWILERARPDDPRLAGLRRAPFPEQIEVFTWQLALAASENRAASIHCLDAWGALADLLHAVRTPLRGFLLHAYGGPPEMVRTFAECGAYFSFNGAALKDAGPAQRSRKLEAFKLVPDERLLVETDAPAMPLPPAFRRHELPPTADGQTVNHPGNIAASYAGLAELREVDLATLAAQVEANFLRLFGPHTAPV